LGHKWRKNLEFFTVLIVSVIGSVHNDLYDRLVVFENKMLRRIFGPKREEVNMREKIS
jgi:hypothetical protein